jgi:hypothetical protein
VNWVMPGHRSQTWRHCKTECAYPSDRLWPSIAFAGAASDCRFWQDKVAVRGWRLTEELILELGLDETGCLDVRPERTVFSPIYLAAMEVRWIDDSRVLSTPAKPELSNLDWFRQIQKAALEEYGVVLKVGAGTAWMKTPTDLRDQIENDWSTQQSEIVKRVQ